MKNLLKFLALSLVLAGCDALTGKEVARLPINQLSTEQNLVAKETTLDLKKGDEIGIWSDMDIAHDGDVELRFRIEISRDGKVIDGIEVDPTKKNITLGEVKTTVMNKTTWRFSGKNANYEIKEDGKYTFKGILIASENSSLKITKAELVFKK